MKGYAYQMLAPLIYDKLAYVTQEVAMELQALTSAQRSLIVETLAPLKPSFIYLFGSAQRGELRPESDVDVAFYHHDPIDPMTLLITKERLATALSRDVDLVDLREANDVIRAQVVGYGDVLSAEEPKVLCERQMRWLKQYAMLNRERAPIMSVLSVRGLSMDDVIVNKAANIERCIQRVLDVYGGTPSALDDLTKQDSIILNLQRACEASIDLAMHIVSRKRLGVPQSSRDAFELLAKANLISEELMISLKGMVGFRNIAVHNYQAMKLEVVVHIIEGRLQDLKTFKRCALSLLSEPMV